MQPGSGGPRRLARWAVSIATLRDHGHFAWYQASQQHVILIRCIPLGGVNGVGLTISPPLFSIPDDPDTPPHTMP